MARSTTAVSSSQETTDSLGLGNRTKYFYDSHNQLLSDRGASTIGGSSTTFPEDDYIWLGGRPLLMVKGRFLASTWARQSETLSTWCERNGEYLVCGERPIITDYLGKPVLMLDRGGTAWTATYQAFGFANRHEYRAASPRYQAGSATVATLTEPVPPGFDGTVRLLLSRSNFSSSSTLTVNGVAENAVRGNKSHVWTSWRTSGSNQWTVAWSANTSADYGVDLEAYEVKTKQVGTVWASIPLRLPGQYFDPETELHENHNRYFDPSIGNYLSPEPLLQSPGYVRQMAQSGLSVPTYAYANNNPLRYVDIDGLKVTLAPNASEGLRDALARLRTTSFGESMYDVLDASPIEYVLKDASFGERLGELQMGQTGGKGNEDPKCGRVNIQIDLSNIRTNNRRWKNGWESYSYSDPAAVLAHEFAHGYDYLFGWPPARASEAGPEYIEQLIQERLKR